jgi:hypothetical protein
VARPSKDLHPIYRCLRYRNPYEFFLADGGFFQGPLCITVVPRSHEARNELPLLQLQVQVLLVRIDSFFEKTINRHHRRCGAHDIGLQSLGYFCDLVSGPANPILVRVYYFSLLFLPDLFYFLTCALLYRLQPFHTKMENKLEELSIVLLIITFAAQLSTSNPAHFMGTT